MRAVLALTSLLLLDARCATAELTSAVSVLTSEACFDTTVVLGPDDHAIVHGASLDTLRLRVIEETGRIVLMIGRETVIAAEIRPLSRSGFRMPSLYSEAPMFRRLRAQGVDSAQAVDGCEAAELAVAESLIVACNTRGARAAPETVFAHTVARLRRGPDFDGICREARVVGGAIRLDFYSWQTECVIGLGCGDAAGRAEFANAREGALLNARNVVRFFQRLSPRRLPRLLFISAAGRMELARGESATVMLNQVAASLRLCAYVDGPLDRKDIEEILARRRPGP
jgi:hypothetical protein